jgi:hypothetical protein
MDKKTKKGLTWVFIALLGLVLVGALFKELGPLTKLAVWLTELLANKYALVVLAAVLLIWLVYRAMEK